MYNVIFLFLLPKNSNKTRHVTTATNTLCVPQNWVFWTEKFVYPKHGTYSNTICVLKISVWQFFFKFQTCWILSNYLARFYWSIWTKKKLSSCNFPPFKPSTVQSRFSNIKSSDNLWLFSKSIFWFTT